MGDDDSLDAIFADRGVEVDEQAYGKISRSQVVHHLRMLDRVDHINGLEHHEQLLVDQKIQRGLTDAVPLPPSHRHPQDRVREVADEPLTGFHAAGAHGHEVDGQRSTMAFCLVGLGVVQRLAVVKHASASGQLDHLRLAGIDAADLLQRVRCLLVVHGHEVTAGDQLHRATLPNHVIKRQPARDEISGSALPVAVVLMPGDRSAGVGRLVQRLVVKKHQIRTDQIFDYVEDLAAVQKLAERDVSFADVHDLMHLSRFGATGFRRFVRTGGEVSPRAGGLRFADDAIVRFAQRLDFFEGKDRAIGQETVAMKGIELSLIESHALYSS